MKKILIYLATLAAVIFFAAPHADAQSNKLIQTLSTTEFCEKVYDINSDTLKYKGNKPAIVDFYADWCGPCKMLAPVLEEIAKEKTNTKFVKINVDDEPELAIKYKVSSIPTVMLFENGNVKETVVGYRPKESFENMLK